MKNEIKVSQMLAKLEIFIVKKEEEKKDTKKCS
jgi:hypothetical protein